MVDDLLNQLSSKFSNLSSELIGKSTTEFRNWYRAWSRELKADFYTSGRNVTEA